jgi:hypothetical protein
MTRDDIIRMAREAGLERIVGVYADGSRIVEVTNLDLLESFAALVAAAERERIKWDSIHSCHADCQNPACVIVREAVAAEREACAKVCMDMWNDWINAPQGKQRDMPNNAQDCAFAIRERGAP